MSFVIISQAVVSAEKRDILYGIESKSMIEK
jgi:hypothetical protein